MRSKTDVTNEIRQIVTDRINSGPSFAWNG